MLALGYEGPETLGTLVAAAAIVVAAILLTLLLIRGLVAFVSDRGAGRSSRPRR